MRIAYVSTLRSATWGGSEELWFQSAEEAIQEGYTIGVFVYNWSEEPRSWQRLREQGVTLYKRKRAERWWNRLVNKVMMRIGNSYPLFLNPYKSLDTFNPDIIVVTDGATYYAANDTWLTKILHRYAGRYIIICQGNDNYHLPASRANAVALFEQAKRIVFVAENNRQQTFHQLAHRLNNTCVIQNPVKVANFHSLPFPDFREGKVHCAVVGRLCISDKGQDIVIRMMAEPYWKQSNLYVRIYGKGADLAYLNELIKYYDVAEKVIIEDYTPIENIWKTCHCLLMPSISEGTPLTLLEAMVTGRVCIATRVGGNDEWITDYENGFLIEAPTQKLISEKLKIAIESKEHWPAIAAKAHNTAMEKLDRHPGHTLLQQIIE